MSVSFASPSVYFFNNLQLFMKNDFYFDYTLTDPCFIYYNIEDMKCLKTKKGYVLYKDQIVLEDDCSSFSTNAVPVIYNPYTQECLEIKMAIIGCHIFLDDLSGCATCNDPNASPSNCLVCKDGYYLDTNSTGKC